MTNYKLTRQPVHPGRIIKDEVINELGISITQAAKMLGISRKQLSNFINEKIDCSSDMAHRLANATQTSVASWMNMQNALSIWREENNKNKFEEVQPFQSIATA